jgi:FixJ family two-component response regulator
LKERHHTGDVFSLPKTTLLYVQGCSQSVKMARLLNINIETVERDRATTMRNLTFSSFASLVRYTIRNKFVEA